jgi:hypothetical protein
MVMKMWPLEMGRAARTLQPSRVVGGWRVMFDESMPMVLAHAMKGGEGGGEGEARGRRRRRRRRGGRGRGRGGG